MIKKTSSKSIAATYDAPDTDQSDTPSDSS